MVNAVAFANPRALAFYVAFRAREDAFAAAVFGTVDLVLVLGRE